MVGFLTILLTTVQFCVFLESSGFFKTEGSPETLDEDF